VYKQKVKSSGTLIGLAMGGLFFILAMLVAVAATSMLIYRKTMGIEQGSYGVVLASLVSSFVGGLVTVSIAREKPLLMSLVSGGIHFILLLLLKLSFFNGSFSNVFLTMIVVLCSSVVAGFGKIGKNKKRYSLRRRRI
jgi:putative membrane protein (TIGR04086 family)